MANQISKTLATLAVGGLVVGLAACGGGTPAPDGAGDAPKGTEAHGCKGTEGAGGAHSCKAGGCKGNKDEAAPPAADPAAAPK